MTETSGKAFRTTLDNFEGPLDLLLYLIRKNEIDIMHIPVALVLEQYEAFVHVLEEIDVNAASDYLVMATTLMEIKSRMLLPQDDVVEEEEYEDPRQDLVRQLLEYRAYKERALKLHDRLDENRRRFRRPLHQLPFPLKRVELGKLSVWDIVTSFLKIQKEVNASGPSEIVFTERPITYYMEIVQDVFTRKDTRTLSFRTLFLSHEQVNRNLVIGLFLAVLELVRVGGLGVTRETPDSEIMVALLVDDLNEILQQSLSDLFEEDAEDNGNGEGSVEASCSAEASSDISQENEAAP